MRRSSRPRPGDDPDAPVWPIFAGLLSGIVAIAGGTALAEHAMPGYMGAEWVARIFPFGLAEHPIALWPITIVATILAAGLLR